MACTPEMVDSVNAPTLVDKRVTIEDISEQLGISVDTEHKSVYDNHDLSKITCRWVLPKYTRLHTAVRTEETMLV